VVSALPVAGNLRTPGLRGQSQKADDPDQLAAFGQHRRALQASPAVLDPFLGRYLLRRYMGISVYKGIAAAVVKIRCCRLPLDEVGWDGGWCMSSRLVCFVVCNNDVVQWPLLLTETLLCSCLAAAI